MADFASRFQGLFPGKRPAEVARLLEIPDPTVRNYFSGRLPEAKHLIKIRNRTNVSIDWLLTGEGQRFALDLTKKELKAIEEVGSHLGKNDAQTIGQLVREKLDELGKIEFDEITIPIYQMYEELSAEKKVEIADRLIRQIVAKAS